MKISPIDIKKQEFRKATFGGYDREEVQSFLEMVAQQLSAMVDERMRLQEKLRDMENKLDHYVRVEEALSEALRTARENSKKVQDNAERKAAIVVQEAEQRAAATVTDAERQASTMIEEAEQARREIKSQIMGLHNRQGEITSKLRGFLMSEMEMLARFTGEEGGNYPSLLPSAERPALEEAIPYPPPAEPPPEASPEPIPEPEMIQQAPDLIVPPLPVSLEETPPEPEDLSDPADMLTAIEEAMADTDVDLPVEEAAIDREEPEDAADDPVKPMTDSEREIEKIRRILEDLE